jgi:hypothetical protein
MPDAQGSERPLQGQDDWIELIERSGAAGARWAARYRSLAADAITVLVDEAVVLLRRGDREAGTERLARAAERIDRLVGLPTSVRHVLDRWLSSAVAYRFYRDGDLAGAAAALDEADAAVARAIAAERSLLVLAVHCYDLRLQRARIARRHNRWPDVHRQVAWSRDMLRGERPLCRLPDAAEVTIGDVDAFYRPTSPGAILLDPAHRERVFDEIVRRIYGFHDVVIPYR